MLPEGTFDGKIAVVTGGGSGLGRAIALEFASLGAAVVVGGRRPEALEETIALIEDDGGAGHAKPTDVRDPDQVEALFDDAVKRFDRIDILVNTAADNFLVESEKLPPDGWRAVVGVVLDGGFFCAQAAGRRMIAQREGGAILSVLASAAWIGAPGQVHTASAKAGLLAMTRTLAIEWAPHRIRVNAICPGPMETESVRAAHRPTEETRSRLVSSVPLGRLASPQEIAWWATALCSPYAGYITGEALTIDGGTWLDERR